MKTRITIVVLLMIISLYWAIYFVNGMSYYDTFIFTMKVVAGTIVGLIFCLIMNWILITKFFVNPK